MSSGPLVVVVGPTASGKSALAMQIAKKWRGEIIAADSRTIYRGMDIGTAKPSPDDQRAVPHHLLDVIAPGEQFSAAQFKKRATTAIDDILGRGSIPILVGGTGLYVDSVIFDYQFSVQADPKQREYLQGLSIEQLQEMCREKNITLPINILNKRHLVRALETGGTATHKKTLRGNTIVVGITTSREKLRERIEKRVYEMMQSGVVGEASSIGRMYDWQGEALKGNVYPILRNVIEGDMSRAEAVGQIVKSDLRLAKRQMTWFKRNPYIIWSDNPDDLLRRVDTFLERYKQSVS